MCRRCFVGGGLELLYFRLFSCSTPLSMRLNKVGNVGEELKSDEKIERMKMPKGHRCTFYIKFTIQPLYIIPIFFRFGCMSALDSRCFGQKIEGKGWMKTNTHHSVSGTYYLENIFVVFLVSQQREHKSSPFFKLLFLSFYLSMNSGKGENWQVH